jgi:hypothetical protein
MSARAIAAVSKAGQSSLNGASLKEYEDMALPPDGEGWPGVDASSRQDTMEGGGPFLNWRNRL